MATLTSPIGSGFNFTKDFGSNITPQTSTPQTGDLSTVGSNTFSPGKSYPGIFNQWFGGGQAQPATPNLSLQSVQSGGFAPAGGSYGPSAPASVQTVKQPTQAPVTPQASVTPQAQTSYQSGQMMPAVGSPQYAQAQQMQQQQLFQQLLYQFALVQRHLLQ